MLLCCCGFCSAGWPTTERNLQLSCGASWYSKWKLLNHFPAPPRAKHSSGNTYMASTHWRCSNAVSAFGVLPHVKRYCIEELCIARCTGKQESPYLQVTWEFALRRVADGEPQLWKYLICSGLNIWGRTWGGSLFYFYLWLGGAGIVCGCRSTGGSFSMLLCFSAEVSLSPNTKNGA